MRAPRLVFPEAFVTQGYAFVLVDVRGSGASFGYRTSEFSADERADAVEILDWIVKQPWSDGKVGGYGASYMGTAAELLLATQHPSVKAIATISSPYDLYLDVALPGGILWTEFLRDWGRANQALDSNRAPKKFGPLMSLGLKGVRPVGADASGELLQSALQEHTRSYDLFQELQKVTYRDDRFGDDASLDAVSPHSYRSAIRASNVPIYSMAGWFDLGTYAQSAIERFRSTPNPGSRLTIGPWPHSYIQIHPGHPVRASRFANHWEVLRFFNYHLKGIPGRIATSDPVHYWTIGEEKWKTATTWPPSGTRLASYFFGPRHILTSEPPGEETGWDPYQVDNAYGRNVFTRWDERNHEGAAGFSDTDPSDGHLLSYESSPLDTAIEVTGQPLIRLSVASTAADGQFFAYLEDTAPNREITYVTEGLFRSLHRQLGHGTPPYAQTGPWHTFLRADALPLVPGQAAELIFELLPVSYLFPAGHRIRLVLSGADKNHFDPMAGPAPKWRILRSREHPSQIALPLISRLIGDHLAR
jgi:putative CocE/NonD family hydrolase